MTLRRPVGVLVVVEAIFLCLLAVVELASQLDEPVEVARERQHREQMRAFALSCADGQIGKQMAAAAPGWAGVCTTVAASDIALQTDRLAQGEMLATQYLYAVRTLALSVRGPFHYLSDDLLATVTVDGRYAEGIRTVARNAGACATNAMGSMTAVLPDDRRLLRFDVYDASVIDRTEQTVALKVVALEGFANCVVTGRTPDRFVLGTVDADMLFRATPQGWKLEGMTACPRMNEPGFLSYGRKSRDESVFRFIADLCHP